MDRKTPRRARRGFAWLIAPPSSLRALRAQGQPGLSALWTARTRLLLLIALTSVGIAVLLGAHATHAPLLGIARQAVLVLGAVVLLLLSGRLAPQMRLLYHWAEDESRRRDGTRGETLLRVLGRLSAPPPPASDDHNRDDHNRKDTMP